ncbi:MAG: cyanophycin synthetase [Chloroflexota bacterium]|nr:cyanophycin synthetase [Chloroflexota bacterium]
MIEIRRSKVYRGPNLWARVPVVQMLVDIGELEERPTNLIPGFTEQLTGLIPSLHNHGCSLGHPGGFLERMRKGTWMGHVLEHVALELQNLTGAHVTRGKTRSTDEHGLYNVIYAYTQEDVGLASGQLARQLLNQLVYGCDPVFDYTQELEHLIRLAERTAYGPSTAAIIAEAERDDIPVLRLDPDRSLVQLGHGCYQRRIWATLTSHTSDIASTIAGNKELTSRLLRNVGIPVPGGTLVHSLDEACTVANRIGYPVVLKPLDGNHGRGVCLNVCSDDDLRACYARAAAESRNGVVVVEQFIAGKDYRILVINKQVVAVAERVPAHVMGDGEHTIGELIAITNADPRRGIGHEKVLTRIPLNAHTERTLAGQDLRLDDIPAAGTHVALQQTGNMSTGGTSIDRTDDIHPDNAAIARQAAMVVGLDVAGIDFLCPDIAQSVREGGGAIVEVNAAPGFRMHTHPTQGQPRRVGRAVIDMLFADAGPARIPILAITGTNGKTTTTRMIAHILRATGQTVGMTTSDGIFIDGVQIEAGDSAGPISARMVLQNPIVDCAVLETARGGILREGLGFDRCNIAVVTNVSYDHLGQHGIMSLEDLARVKAVVPQSVFRDGASVLNADDPWTVEMARTARGEIIFFAMDAENLVVREHVRERGRAVVLQQTPAGDMLTLLEGNKETGILLASEIPATLGGRIRVNIANALAASAGTLAHGVPLEVIRNALRTFTADYAQTPGRFNLLDVEGRQVVMDYGHNLSGLAAVADFVRRTAPPRSVGVIAIAGDRRDEDIRAFGELAGRTFDQIVIREHDNPRGRQRGEVARLLKEAVIASGFPAELVTVVLDEVEAVHAAIDLAAPGDLVIALVYRIPNVWEALLRRVEQTAERDNLPGPGPARSTPRLQTHLPANAAQGGSLSQTPVAIAASP